MRYHDDGSVSVDRWAYHSLDRGGDEVGLEGDG